MKNTNRNNNSGNPRYVTILLDEPIESIIDYILQTDKELGLDSYIHTNEYLEKLDVISDALTTGFEIIQQDLNNEKIRQGKENILKKSELKASFKLVPGKLK